MQRTDLDRKQPTNGCLLDWSVNGEVPHIAPTQQRQAGSATCLPDRMATCLLGAGRESCCRCQRLSARGDVDQRETFLARGVREPLIERHQLKR